MKTLSKNSIQLGVTRKVMTRAMIFTLMRSKCCR